MTQICKTCGVEHGMGIEDMINGDFMPLDVCYNCLKKIDDPIEEVYPELNKVNNLLKIG